MRGRRVLPPTLVTVNRLKFKPVFFQRKRNRRRRRRTIGLKTIPRRLIARRTRKAVILATLLFLWFLRTVRVGRGLRLRRTKSLTNYLILVKPIR